MGEMDIAGLDAELRTSKEQLNPKLNDSEFFELFCAQKILRNYQVDADDIDAGLVGTTIAKKRKA